MSSACSCSGAPKLIFACSGASDVGAITDQAARKLNAEGAGKMYCLAGIGGRVSGIMKTSEAACSILAIDGCPLSCAKRTLEEAGFKNFEHLQLASLEMPKGQTPPSDSAIEKVVAAGREILGKGCCS